MRRPAWLAARLVLVAVALLVPPAGAALAHAELIAAVPAPGATVSGRIAELTLNFSEDLLPGSEVTLFAANFARIEGVTSTVAGSVLTARLTAPLAPGTYTVQWLAVSADGHPIGGSYQFGVGEGMARGPWIIGAGVAALVAVGVAVLAVARRRRGVL
jgi:methionine-rich copper-binding protein CopC